MLELEGEAGSGLVVVLCLLLSLTAARCCHPALSLLLVPLAREGPEGRLQLPGRRHGLVVVVTNRFEVSSDSFF